MVKILTFTAMNFLKFNLWNYIFKKWNILLTDCYNVTFNILSFKKNVFEKVRPWLVTAYLKHRNWFLLEEKFCTYSMGGLFLGDNDSWNFLRLKTINIWTAKTGPLKFEYSTKMKSWIFNALIIKIWLRRRIYTLLYSYDFPNR